MNKNRIILLAIIGVAAVAGLFLFYKSQHLSQNKPGQNTDSTNEMTGDIVSVRTGFITVKGTIDFTGSKSQEKTIEFAVTDQTVLKNNSIVITAEQFNSGKQFHPETQIKTGKISDLVSKPKIIKIQSKENLFATDHATATELTYLTYDMPTSLTK